MRQIILNSWHKALIMAGSILLCFAVNQLRAGNVAPLQVSIEGPAAGLVWSTNRFRIAISGGRPPYEAIVYRGSTNLMIVPRTFQGFYYDYVVPDEPKREMIECIVTDTDPYTNQPPEAIMTANRAHAEAPFWQVKLMVDRIAFNYNTTASLKDALNIRKNYSTEIVAPEYITGSKNEPAAFLRNQRVEIAVRLKVEPSGITNLIIGADSTGCLGNVEDTTIQFINGVSRPLGGLVDGSYAPCTTINSTPNWVCKSEVGWAWKVKAVNGVAIQVPPQFQQTTGHVFYIVYDKAKSPWLTCVCQNSPWADVLDYACDWAANCGDADSIVRSITSNAYDGFGKEYDGGDSHTLLGCNLTKLIADNWADCRDMAAVIQLFTRAIGVSQVRIRRVKGGVDGISGVPGFITKPILLVGEPQWRAAVFIIHDFAYYNSLVYDACLKLNQNAPYIASGQILNNYKEDLYNSNGWFLLNTYEITEIK